MKDEPRALVRFNRTKETLYYQVFMLLDSPIKILHDKENHVNNCVEYILDIAIGALIKQYE